jgi:hypothetical protein
VKHGTPTLVNQKRGTSRWTRKRWIVTAAGAVAAALLAAGAVVAVVNDLSPREIVDGELGTVLAAQANRDPAPGQNGTAPGQNGTAPGETTRPTAPADPNGPAPTPPGRGDPNPPAFWEPQEVAEAVELDEPAAFVESVRAEVTKLEAVQGEARGPGEISGPAVRVTVEITNETSAPIELDSTIVAMYIGATEDPAVQLSGPGARSLDGDLDPGASASGVYVYAVPNEDRSTIRITVSYTPQDRAVAFEGSAPTG